MSLWTVGEGWEIKVHVSHSRTNTISTDVTCQSPDLKCEVECGGHRGMSPRCWVCAHLRMAELEELSIS